LKLGAEATVCTSGNFHLADVYDDVCEKDSKLTSYITLDVLVKVIPYTYISSNASGINQCLEALVAKYN